MERPPVEQDMLRMAGFDLEPHFRYLRPLGRGAYGTVIACRDKRTGRDVAIKKISRAFQDLTNAKRLLRELMLMRHLRHENMVRLLDILAPKQGPETFDDVYMVMELMETDLHRIICSSQALTDDHVQFFVNQILKGLKYMHSAGVVHRDLKPSNLLVNADCDLKICDFGLAREMNTDEVVLTEYVVTRWYRAPEVMLSSNNYTSKVDVWSVGCIMAELLLRRPLFRGDDYIGQLNLIFDLLGTPSEEDKKGISDKATRFVNSRVPRPPGSLEEIMPSGTSKNAIDLLQKMIMFNPDKRITVDEALAHPYLKDYWEEEKPECGTLFRNPPEKLNMSEVRHLVWNEILNYHPDGIKLPSHGALAATSSSISIDLILPSDQHSESDGHRTKRRRPEDTITPTKPSSHDVSLFAQLATSAIQEKRTGEGTPDATE